MIEVEDEINFRKAVRETPLGQLLKRLIHEDADDFWVFDNGSWCPPTTFSKWVYEADIPWSTFRVRERHLKGIDFFALNFFPETSAVTNYTLSEMRKIGVFGVALAHETQGYVDRLAFFSEQDAVVAQTLLDFRQA